MRRAVYAGTFDPLTKGHWDVILQGAALFDELIVAVGVNPSKKPIFTAKERADIIIETVAAHRNASQIKAFPVTVDVFEDEFLAKYAERTKCTHILRGLRDSEDFRQEEAYRFFNTDICPKIRTVYVMPHQKVAAVSSSAVKSMIGPQGWKQIVPLYVPSPAFDQLLKKFG